MGGGEINIWSLFKSYCWSNHWIHKERNLTMTKHGWPWEWNINLWREYKVDPTLFNTLGYNPSQRKFIAPIRCNRSYRRYSIHIEEIYMTMSHRIRSNPVNSQLSALYHRVTGQSSCVNTVHQNPPLTQRSNKGLFHPVCKYISNLHPLFFALPSGP